MSSTFQDVPLARFREISESCNLFFHEDVYKYLTFFISKKCEFKATICGQTGSITAQTISKADLLTAGVAGESHVGVRLPPRDLIAEIL